MLTRNWQGSQAPIGSVARRLAGGSEGDCHSAQVIDQGGKHLIGHSVIETLVEQGEHSGLLRRQIEQYTTIDFNVVGMGINEPGNSQIHY
jgi:hypothetical protein